MHERETCTGSSAVVKRVLILWKNISEKLRHVHKLLYTWWCWHICKGEEVRVGMIQLGEEKRSLKVTKRWPRQDLLVQSV